jgi:hypothetical protein
VILTFPQPYAHVSVQQSDPPADFSILQARGRTSKQNVILGAILGGVLGGIAIIGGLLAYCIISRKRRQAAQDKARGLPTANDFMAPPTSSEVAQKPVGYEHSSSSVAVPISADTRH